MVISKDIIYLHTRTHTHICMYICTCISYEITFDSYKVDSDGDSNPTVAHERNESQSVTVEPDNGYAVFATYVEIYNNSVYDLLDEDDIRTK